MFRKLFIIVGLLLSPLCSFAQSGQEQTRSDVTLNDGVKLPSQLKDSRLLANAYYQLGHLYSDRNLYPEAIAAYENSKDGFERAGLIRDEIYVLADLGALYFVQEDYKKARECSEQSLHLAESANSSEPAGAYPDDFGKARALLTLGDLDTDEGNYEQAVEKLQNSLALFQRLNGSSSSYDLYIAGVYGALGRAYPEIGDSTTGLLCLNKALDIAGHRSDNKLTASLRNDIGYLYLEQEDYAQASAQFGKSLKIYETENNEREHGRVLLNLGVTEQRRSNYDDALRYFRRSIESARSTGAVDNQIASYEGIGVVLSAKRDFAGAIESLNNGLALAKQTGNKIRQAEILWRSAQAYYEQSNYSQSTELAESALTLARASHLPKLTYLATTTLGESLAAQKKSDLAIETLTQAVRQLEVLREQVAGSEMETQLFLENKVAAYDALVDLLIKQGKIADALVYAERAKGRVLLDVLRDGKPNLARALTPTEKAETQRLNRRISEINDTIRKQEITDSSSLNSLYAQLDAARMEYRSFQDALYVTHPNLTIRSGHTESLSSSDLNGLTTDGDTAYLEYVASKDGVSLFVLSKNNTTGAPEIKVYRIAIKPEDLNRKVNEFHDALAEHQSGYGSTASELYALLIGPAEQQLRNISTICIVPDSFLWNVPFQALMTPDEHFLIENHAVYYAPSLSVLREMNRRKGASEKTASSLIAFGNPVIGKDEQGNTDVCPLPEAEQEVSSIARSFDSKTGKVLIGRDAAEKTFKSLAPAYSIIHLATHGIIDNRQPLYSHLLLTKTEGDPDNDGRLEARQIIDMNLHADLAVLSACETANGRIAPGEGVMGMSWAFFVAGTRSMLVSQWKINSASTSELMLNFYKNLNRNDSDIKRNKAQALRNAAVVMIKDRQYQHPFYWAGFGLIGSPAYF
jgi:CHAT domain-containing protein/Tfp pilus assembly protein PilF